MFPSRSTIVKMDVMASFTLLIWYSSAQCSTPFSKICLASSFLKFSFSVMSFFILFLPLCGFPAIKFFVIMPHILHRIVLHTRTGTSKSNYEVAPITAPTFAIVRGFRRMDARRFTVPRSRLAHCGGVAVGTHCVLECNYVMVQVDE